MTGSDPKLERCSICGEKWEGVDLITPLPNVYLGEYPLRDGETSPERVAFRIEEGLPVDDADPLGIERLSTLNDLLGEDGGGGCCTNDITARGLVQRRRVEVISLPPQEEHVAQGLLDRSTTPHYDSSMSPTEAMAECVIRQLGVLVSGLGPDESITLPAPSMSDLLSGNW